MAERTDHSAAPQRQPIQRLLIIEDDSGQLKTLSAIMRNRGFEVASCHTAAEGMEHFERDGADVVVLDIHLPDANGMEVMRALADDSDVPVILHTAFSSFESAKEAVNLGAFAYVEKGGDPNELVHHVHRAALARLHRRAEEAEDKQAQSESLLRAVSDETADCIFVKDRQGRYLFANPATLRVMGRASLEEIIGRKDIDIFPAKVGRELQENDSRIMASLEPEVMEEIIEVDGAMRTFRSAKTPYRDEHGNVIGILGTSRDITEYKRATEERAAMLQTAMDGFWIVDKTGNLLDVNTAYCKMTGYTREELLGTRISELDVNQSPEEIAANIQGAIASGSGRLETRHRCKDGRIIDVEISARYMPDIERFSVFLHDITDRKQAAEALQYRLEFEHIINSISSKFVRQSADKVDEVIQDGLKDIGEFTHADRAYLFLLRGDSGLMDNTHEWCSEGVEPQIENLKGISLDKELPWFAEHLGKHEVFHVPDVTALPAGAELEKAHFAEQGIQSLVVVPMLRDSDLVGFLGFDSVCSKRTWSRDTLALLQFVGQIFTGALWSKRAENALRKSEAAIRENEQKLLHITENIRDVFWVGSLGGNEVHYISPAYEEVWGRSCQSLYDAPRSWLEGVHKDDRESVLASVEARARGDKDGPDEYRVVRPDGSVRWVFTRAYPVMDDSGVVSRIVGIIEDITERKLAERQIADLAKFPSESPYPVLRILPDGTISHANPTATRLLNDYAGASAEKAPDDWLSNAASAIESGAIVSREIQYDQSVFALSFVPIADAGYVNVYGIDITDRKRMEAQYHQAQKMEAIGQLAGGVAHDFRNQLTIIQGYASMLLRRSPSPEPDQEYLKVILGAVDRSATITNQLLVFSRKESLHVETIDLTESIADMSKLLPPMIGEDIRLLIASSQQACFCLADPGLLQQAIMNLVVNARHAMPAGGELTIETGHVEVDQEALQDFPDANPGPYAVISVSDTGTGMDTDTLGKIFDPFFTTKEVGMGTGMGLAMVYGFVAHSGGFIKVDSKPGQGSTFRLHFPLVQGIETPDTTTPSIESGALPRGVETLLVVEDDEVVRHLMIMVLRECGYTVLEASNAYEALPLGEHYQGRIDLLVTDVVMPKMNGVQMAERLRKARPDIAVLFVSGYGDSAVSQDTLIQPDTGMLTKPINNMALAKAVRQMLDATNTAQQRIQ
jgi:two-component system, cell cycle sensor histidine kinase and response regulator CckA